MGLTNKIGNRGRFFNRIVFILFFISTLLFAQAEFSDYNSMAGAFSRMGFGARGISMGNSISSVTEGNLISYYNPALSAFQEGNYFQTSYSFLSLDRSLNFLNFTRKFELGKNKSADGKPHSTAGISVGIINAGVSNIDARDNQGEKFKTLSTSENQFFLSLSNRFSEKFALGIGLKFYYHSLYENISAGGLGFDIGALYKYNNNLNFAVVLTDINSKYKWDTSDLYGVEGNSTTNRFPFLMKISAAYKFNEPKLLATLELEHSNSGTDFIKLGAEYNIYEQFFLRGGIDRISFSNFDIPMRPALGFSYSKMFGNLLVGINYAFGVEPYSSHDQHIIGVELLF
ncbi:MAG: hypothetical protein KDC52_01055 [Ignavibacteriae bacterium]|nr:hypothetical protein [Ignavibacteriota bacterium]